MSAVDKLVEQIMRLTFREVVELCVRLEAKPEWKDLQAIRREHAERRA